MDTTRLIKSIIIGLVAMFLCLYIGIGAATAQTETTLKAIAVLLLIGCIASGPRIWLVLPLAQFTDADLIRGFTGYELAQMLFISFALLQLLMRKLPAKPSFGELDGWLWLVVLCTVQAYARHPVGLNIFGAGDVGAKPYFLVALALVASLILGNYRVKPGDLKWAMWLTVLGSLSSPVLNKLLSRGFGGGGGVSADYSNMSQYQYGAGAATRNETLVNLANMLARVVASLRHPLKACFHPFWGTLILLSLAAAAGSGFRNTVIGVGLTYLFAMAYRGGVGAVLLSALAGVTGLVVLSFANLISPFPPNVQRTLTIFPGTWDESYKKDAKESTEWRVTMWKEALFTDKYIKDKFFGDGLGFSREQFRQMLAMSAVQGVTKSGLTAHQESIMINGDFHSGPVQTIRTIGYSGLVCLLLAMTRLAVHAHRQIMRCKGTEWFPVALFFGIPLLVLPLFWTFVFGLFGSGVVTLFFGMAMMKILQHNVPLPAYETRRRQTYVPLAAHNTPMRDPGTAA